MAGRRRRAPRRPPARETRGVAYGYILSSRALMIDDAPVLRAGPVSALFLDGDLRHIRIEGREVLNRVYFALRDAKWTTLRNALSHVRVAERNGGFSIDYEAECRA